MRAAAPKTAGGGFTLLEVMVAMVILATAFLSLLSLSNSTVRQAMYNRQNTLAVTLARHRMEILTLKVRRGEVVGSDFTGETGLDEGFRAMVERDYPGFTIEEEAGPLEDLPFEIPDGVELTRIIVRVKWDGGFGEEESYTLENVVAKYGQ